MSYEGYSQVLCEHGHLSNPDCMEDDSDYIPPCGHKVAWRNMVNLTNGSYEGGERIDGYVELEIAEQKSCDKCNSILETTYKIPYTKERNGR